MMFSVNVEKKLCVDTLDIESHQITVQVSDRTISVFIGVLVRYFALFVIHLHLQLAHALTHNKTFCEVK